MTLSKKWLLEKGVPPSEIFVVSFTRAASTDLRRRIRNYCAQNNVHGADSISVSTLHSLALAALKKGKVIPSSEFNIAILSGWEVKEVFDKEFTDEHGDIFVKQEDGTTIKSRAAEIRRFYEAFWSTGEMHPNEYDMPEIMITDLEKEKFEQFLKIFSQAYLAIFPGQLIAKCLKERDAGLFDPAAVLGIRHFIVDEFQDLNYADNRLVEMISSSPTAPNIYILGDDDQSVYGFRFAYQGIKAFKNAADYILKDCFRCTPEILRTATNFIRINSVNSRLAKDISAHYADIPSVIRRHRFESDTDEARYIAQSCKKLIAKGIAPDSILILINKRPLADPIIKAFDEIEEKIAIDLPPDENKLFIDAEWSRYAIALLRVVCDRSKTDHIAHRLVLGFQSKVGIRTCVNIKNISVEALKVDYPVIFYQPVQQKAFSAVERKAIFQTHSVLKKLFQLTDDDTINMQQKDLGVLIRANYALPNFDTEWENLINSLPTEMTLNELQVYLTSQSRAQAAAILKKVYERLELDLTGNIFFQPRVQIMTMHGAKGLNAQVVFIPGLEQKTIPGEKNTKRSGSYFEAARLLYVSITRASATCIMTFSKKREIRPKKYDYNRRGSDLLVDLGGEFIPSEVLSDSDVILVKDTCQALAEVGSKFSGSVY